MTTSTAPALLDTLQARGLTVAATGDKLRILPASMLTDELRGQIKAHKPELLRLITGPRIFDAGEAYRSHQQTNRPQLDQAHRIRVLSEPLEPREVRAAFKSLRPGVAQTPADRLELALHVALLRREIDPQELLSAVATSRQEAARRGDY